jgi:tetratricopeptide (TPR) repeat protein
MIRLRRLLLACAALAVAAPAAAVPLPPPEEAVRTPAERALLERLMALAAAREDPAARPDAATRAAQLAEADAILAGLSPPARLRGFVQILRAEMLGFAGRDEEATAAALEAIEILPGYSGPHYIAADVETYRDRPREAVDHYAAAAAIDPEPLAKLQDWAVNSLVRRLNQHRDDEGLLRFAEMLDRAGWRGAPDTQSTLALVRIEARVKAGDVAGATRLLDEVVRPGAFSAILTDKRLAPLRPAAILHAGPRLEKLWPRYLAVVEAQWRWNGHERAPSLYAAALVAAGHDRSLIAAFAPRFEGPIDPADDNVLFTAGMVARAYARLGQWERGYALLDKVDSAFAGVDTANRLNIAIARAQLLGIEGRLEEALSAYEAVIARSRGHSGEVGEHNLAIMHGQRACLLEELGRGGEASDSIRIVREREALDPASLANLLLCRGDFVGARKVIVAALDRESTRAAALDLVQLPERPPYPSARSRLQAERWARLRADPKLRAAALRYGDLLAEPLNASAPPDPLSDPAPPGSTS